MTHHTITAANRILTTYVELLFCWVFIPAYHAFLCHTPFIASSKPIISVWSPYRIYPAI